MNIAIHMTVFVHAWRFAAHLNHLALPVLNVAVVIADKLRLKERESPANCRFCRGKLKHTFVDLGMSPPCEAILAQSQLNQMEAFYPLHVFVCDSCFLVQLQEYVAPENIFTEYAYFSSYSDSWLAHANSYSKRMIERFGFDRQSQVIELGSNDGYLLQYFVDAGIPVLGIEPAANVAKVAVNKGIPTVVKFFGAELAEQLRSEGMAADLLLGNNVLAQVPNLRSFVKGMKILLKPQGILTLEFPHLMRLMEENQFDTIYHEHFSYFSFITVTKILAEFGLTVFDVEELPTHGGSLRVYARHPENAAQPVTSRVQELSTREIQAGLTCLETYSSFAEKVKETKRKILHFLIRAKREGKTVVGYGAPGKGNTLLNYCGIRTDFLDYTVDRNPYKHGKFLAGTHIPVFEPAKIRETKPDYILILPWNLKDEIARQLSYVREWGGRLAVPIPEVEILP
jgi:2-polyprenyl-3-methyl-5-hydroxy-6-metoxy-1,4-benzoquinol methylase